MAGPQPLTPRSVRPSLPKRRFTLAHANSALPLVRRIVADIVRTSTQAATLQQAQAAQQPPQSQLDSAMTRLEDYIDELTEIGCELKDMQLGLIDFIGRHQGRDVYLCWKLGEERITHWHELDSGYAGRQPVSKLQETD